MRIKRTKTGSGGPNDLPPSTAIHWAKEVDGAGCVVAWTPREEEAADYGGGITRKVIDQYAGRKSAGTISFEGEDVVADGEGMVTESYLESLILENDSLRAEVTKLRARLAALEPAQKRGPGRPRKIASEEPVVTESHALPPSTEPAKE